MPERGVSYLAVPALREALRRSDGSPLALRELERAADAERVSSLDLTDLRGWQYVIVGTVLGTVSPYGFDADMHGRYAWLQETPGGCLRGLLRLRTLLEATEVLDLPAEPFTAPAGRTRSSSPTTSTAWRRTTAARRSSDSSSNAPRTGAARARELLGPADDRPEAEIAAEVTAAGPAADPGDGAGPADDDARFAAFAGAVQGTWLRGDRAFVRSAGPVPSSRFA